MLCVEEEPAICVAVPVGTGLMSGEEWAGCCEGLLTWAGILEGGCMDRERGELRPIVG